MRTLPLIGSLALALAFTGCKKDEASAGGEVAAEATAEKAVAAEKPTEKAAAAEKPGHPLWPGVDLAAEAKRLTGKWQVMTTFGRGEPDVWAIEGDSVTITKADGTTELGKLKFEMPGRLGVKVGDMTSFYAYARDGETTWIGLGTGGVKVGDALYVAESRGLVAFDGKRCTYRDKKMSFGGAVEFEEPIEVECDVQVGGDKAAFNYKVPKFMKEGEFEDESIAIVGEALLNDQLRSDHQVKPAPADGAAPPAEGGEAAEKAPAKPE